MKVFAAAAEAIRTGRRGAIATLIAVGGSTPRSSGARMLVYADGDQVGTIGGGTLERRVTEVALQVIARGRPARYAVHLTRDLGMCCGGQVEVYVEPLQGREPITVYGAGHVALALAPMLLALDFDVTIVDARPELATAERFPGCAVLLTDAVAHADAEVGGPLQHWLVVTHDHALDQALLQRLLPLPCAWIGMIGSRAKVARFFGRLEAAGIDPVLFRRLCAPVGLDLGAETPAEIAIAIAAELVRVRRHADRTPGPLSEIPLPSRGGDGRAAPPAWNETP